MKKILISLIMIATTLCTIYTVMVWEPSEDDYKGNSNLVVNDAEGKNDSINNVKEGSGKIDEGNQKKEESKSAVGKLQLLKMSKDEILDSLSVEEKAKVVRCVNKLQEIDRKRIIQSVEQEDNIEQVQKAYGLMKSRLSTKDFNEFNEIIAPFVNMELLKQEI